MVVTNVRLLWSRTSSSRFAHFLFKSPDFNPSPTIMFVGKTMKPIRLALVAAALLVAVTPVALALASPLGFGQANHPTGPPTTVPCTFDQPGSLPSQASDNATAALAARSTH